MGRFVLRTSGRRCFDLWSLRIAAAEGREPAADHEQNENKRTRAVLIVSRRSLRQEEVDRTKEESGSLLCQQAGGRGAAS